MTRRVTVAALVSLVLGGGVLVCWGLSTLVPALLLALAVVVLLTELAFARDSSDPPARPPPGPSVVALLPPGPPDRPLPGWSDAELCLAWRVTYVQLQLHRDAVWTAQLAEQRCTYLDELQRRDPTGFAAWIGSGARAAGDPARYLTGTR